MAKKKQEWYKKWWIWVIIGIGVLFLFNQFQESRDWNLIQDDTGTLFCLEREPVKKFEVKISSHDTLLDCQLECDDYAFDNEFIECGERGFLD